MTIRAGDFKVNIIQSCQAAAHLCLAIMATFTVADNYLWGFSSLENVQCSNISFGVNLLYISSLCYHLLMYFKDPSTGTTLQGRHVIFICVSTILLLTQLATYGIFLIFINYLLDIHEFICEKLMNVEKVNIVKICVHKIHYICTLSLIVISWVYNFACIGVVIMFVHDVTNVPIFILEVIRRRRFSNTFQIPLLVFVMVTWIFYRVYYMDYLIILLLQTYVQEKHMFDSNTLYMAGLCISFLCIEHIFNIFWTFILCENLFTIIVRK